MRSLALTFTLAFVFPVKAADPIPLHPLRNQDHLDESGGCGYQLEPPYKTKRDVLQSPLDDSNSAWINLGAGDIRLTLVHQPQSPGSNSSEEVLHFSGPGLEVIVKTRTTESCAPDDEQCETWSEEGSITVRTPKRTWTSPVIALCGS